MILLAPLGLALDMLGVALLGVDLLRVQRHLRKSAQKNGQLLDEAFPEFRDLSSVQTDMKTGISGGGEFDWDGGVDADGLEKTLNAFRRELAMSQAGTTDAIGFLFSQNRVQHREANRSLFFTYLGLPLIVLGFAMQIAAFFFNNPHLIGE